LGELVLAPLDIVGRLGAESGPQAARLAGVRGEHAGTLREPFNSPFWRSLALPWGGLVTNAEGALRLIEAFAGRPSDFLRPGTLTADNGWLVRAAPKIGAAIPE